MPGRNSNYNVNQRGNSSERGRSNHSNRYNNGNHNGHFRRGNCGHNNNRRQEDQTDKHVVFKYHKEKKKTKSTDLEFVPPGEDKKKKVVAKVFKGNSYEDLIRAIAGLWDIIDEYDLLKISSHNHKRIRGVRVSLTLASLIKGTISLAKASDPHKAERDINRRLVFSWARELLQTTESRSALEKAFMVEKDKVVDIEDLFTQKVLENRFKEVLREVLPKRALTHQMDYMQNNSKQYRRSNQDRRLPGRLRNDLTKIEG